MIILVIIAFMILLDFIPVKTAVNIEKGDLKKLLDIKGSKELYICRYTQVTGSIWLAIGDENGVRDLIPKTAIYLSEPLRGKDPLKSLNRSFIPYYTGNEYVFIGNTEQTEKTGDLIVDGVQELMLDFKVDEWRIVYPIRRDSLRDMYAPKSYLTIYDFIKLPW
ncbi:hypothetical protein HNQ80_003356 [Anaerosolibacter carboniphilus]|uniref:Uncharacterized protein n=1 Tax=Anaerosolibacter carboniphilus TaxID=1417629 RepID=A0A841KV15_9FIRM|nr:hypothetical protein [Anaerosolibacter carboniphilus]MBB6217237.1 hypothetical protein [Anaerosolibacter carboniphilus]